LDVEEPSSETPKATPVPPPTTTGVDHRSRCGVSPGTHTPRAPPTTGGICGYWSKTQQSKTPTSGGEITSGGTKSRETENGCNPHPPANPGEKENHLSWQKKEGGKKGASYASTTTPPELKKTPGRAQPQRKVKATARLLPATTKLTSVSWWPKTLQCGPK
jgi:hypothetical protein